jgi:glycosyltransferase involved in cell wall biosynthesis
MIDIVLPVYNHERFIQKTIESILNQTINNWKLIIVNDGSTDKSREIAEKYISDNIILINHEKNKRLPSALNTGFKFSTSPFLTWISSDCWCNNNFLEKLYITLCNADDSVGMVYSNFNCINESNDIICKYQLNYPQKHNNTFDLFQSLLDKNCCGASFMYKRKCMDTIGLYDESLEGCEDYDYWIRISEHFKFMFIDDILYNYRTQHKDRLAYSIYDKIRKNEMIVKSNAWKRRGIK